MKKKDFIKILEKREVPQVAREALNLYYDDWEALAKILDVELVIEDVNPYDLCDIKYTLKFGDSYPEALKQEVYNIFNTILNYQRLYDTILGLQNLGLLTADNVVMI